MRYLWIALGIAALHRLVVVGLAVYGVGLQMNAFSGGAGVEAGKILINIAYLLDFPLVLASLLEAKIQTGSFLLKQVGGLAVMTVPWFAYIAWSVCVGILLALPLYLRHKKKYGHLPSRYWRKGM